MNILNRIFNKTILINHWRKNFKEKTWIPMKHHVSTDFSFLRWFWGLDFHNKLTRTYRTKVSCPKVAYIEVANMQLTPETFNSQRICSSFNTSVSQSVVSRSATSASPKNLLKRQKFKPHSRPTSSETLEASWAICFNQHFIWSRDILNLRITALDYPGTCLVTPTCLVIMSKIPLEY